MMKRTIFALAMIAILCTSCVKDMQEGTMNTEDTQTLGAKLVGRTDAETEKGVLLIKVDAASARRLEKDTGQETIADIFGSCGIQSVTYALGVRPGNIELARKFGLDRWYKVEYDKNSDNEEVARNLASRPNIESIQYNTFMEAPAIEQPVEADMPVMSRSASSDLEMPFNDPYLPAQWNMINDGSMKGSVAGADIGVKDAWKLAAGDPSIIVAVFDCAVSNIHSDLRDAVWVNEQEKVGSRGVDDDGNGYVDDVYGFNFVGCRTEEQEDGSPIIVNSKNLDYSGRSGHGTHVAGVIGAVNGNGKGISSIAGGTGKKDGVRLLSCQIFDGTGSATDKQRGQAYVYAADMGACIAQCSYGNTDIITKDDIYINGIDGDDVPDSEKVKGSPFEYAALMYFLEKANHPNLDGNLAIYSSMNEGHPYSGYPGALSCCISVSAFGYDFTPGWYSNYGPGVKISAPGGEFSSEQDKHKAILSTGVSNAKEPSPSYTEDDLHYVYMNGTSMACPHVSGVAALGISYAMTLNKTFSREEFISKLLTSVNDLDQYCTGTKVYKNTLIDLSKYKGKMGTGALDAWKFLMALEGTPVIMAKPGAKRSIRIADYVGNNPVTLDPVDQETMSSLGWDTPPVITEDGMLEFTCTRTGAGKISFSSSIGKDPDMSDGIGGMNYNYEISITCRNNIASNGGWL